MTPAEAFYHARRALNAAGFQTEAEGEETLRARHLVGGQVYGLTVYFRKDGIHIAETGVMKGYPAQEGALKHLLKSEFLEHLNAQTKHLRKFLHDVGRQSW